MNRRTVLNQVPKRWVNLSQVLKRSRRPLLTASLVTGCVLGVRSLGMLQSWELAALDQSFRLRPVEPPDTRIVVVSVDDADIKRIKDWPIPDQVMAQLLNTIKAQKPRAIGLDIYRDVPVESGGESLQQVFDTTPNLVGIEKIADDTGPGVQPPAKLKQRNQIGFNNVVVDSDGRVRRSLLYWNVGGETRRSFALKLALLYLQKEGVTLHRASSNPNYVQLGEAVFPKLRPYDGSYINVDAGGYQILANPRHIESRFPIISLSDVLANRVPPGLMRDRVVLIGSTAASLKDFFYNSYSNPIKGSAQPISGVELHGHFISQLISAALDGRSPLQSVPEPIEIIWIWGWALVGATISWKVRRPIGFFLITLVTGALLVSICFATFLEGWLIPVVPPLLAMMGAAITVTSYIAHLQDELKKSKEFLNSVINTIPDPIFVKDHNHRWIVLNHAYCRFIGYSLNELLEKSDYDFFPMEQAAHFWQQDNIVFQTGGEQESEEEFTNADGTTYMIATKRSLHRDAAGNVFLVGVIRDITRRKQIEEDLKRTADELVRSNAELRQAEDRLRYMAYHDSLTGLPNRELLHDRLNQSLQAAKEHDQLVALLFLDLDGFKQINDSYGHDMGNLLLQAVAQRLSACLRSSDTVARLGGDEFVVLLSSISSLQDVVRVAEKLLDALSKQFNLQGTCIPITTSVGISIFPLDGCNTHDLLKKADLAMYQAKGLGKNRYEFAQKIER